MFTRSHLHVAIPFIYLVYSVALLTPAQAQVTFGSVRPLYGLSSTDVGNDSNAQIVNDGLSTWIVGWHSDDPINGSGPDADILFTRTFSAGTDWTPPLTLNSNATTDNATDAFVGFATDNQGLWIAVWQSTLRPGQSPGDFDIYYSRSLDNGATWSESALLNGNGTFDTGEDFIPKIATDGNGTWVTIWFSNDSLTDQIGTDFDVLYSRSIDNGQTWVGPLILNSNAFIDTGDDRLPQIKCAGGSHWISVWQSNDTLADTIGNDVDILISHSTDDGETWQPATFLNTHAPSDSRGDFDPQITHDGAGNWLAIWDSDVNLGGTIGIDLDILFSRSTDGGFTWSDAAVVNQNASSDPGLDSDPQVTSGGGGLWIAAWFSRDTLGGTIGPDEDILIAQTTDDGMTWTFPAPLNSNATTDSGNDLLPQLSYAQGEWIAVWESTDTLGGTIGPDEDILRAITRINSAGPNWVLYE